LELLVVELPDVVEDEVVLLLPLLIVDEEV
jgi:hypothetical protein